MDNMKWYTDHKTFSEQYCKDVIQKIKNVMDQKSISQVTLANKIGMGQSTLSKFLAGDTRVSLEHIAKICWALEIDPGDILSLNQENLPQAARTVPYNCIRNTETLITSPTHSAFKGYLRDFHVYFNSTISSEDVILEGILKFESSSDSDVCTADLVLDTGKKRADGTSITKHYTGELIISLSMSACYCTLISTKISEICFLVFHHMFLFHEDLICRLACVATVSSGGNKRPTMHRMLISRTPLDVSDHKNDDFKFVRGQLMLNNSEIYITEKAYTNMKKIEAEQLDEEEIRALLDEFDALCDKDKIYFIDEAKLRNSPHPMDKKLKIITLLRKYSISNKYNKISTKSDEYILSYLENKGLT